MYFWYIGVFSLAGWYVKFEDDSNCFSFNKKLIVNIPDIWDDNIDMKAISIWDIVISTCINFFNVCIKIIIFEYVCNLDLLKSKITFLSGLYVLKFNIGCATSFIKTSEIFIINIKKHKQIYLIGVSIMNDTKVKSSAHPKRK